MPLAALRKLSLSTHRERDKHQLNICTNTNSTYAHVTRHDACAVAQIDTDTDTDTDIDIDIGTDTGTGTDTDIDIDTDTDPRGSNCSTHALEGYQKRKKQKPSPFSPPTDAFYFEFYVLVFSKSFPK